MQPNHEKRPTVDELLDRNLFKIIKSTDKSEIRENLLADGKFFVFLQCFCYHRYIIYFSKKISDFF